MSDKVDAEAQAMIAKHGHGKALLIALSTAFIKIAFALLACVAVGGAFALTIRALVFGWKLVW